MLKYRTSKHLWLIFLQYIRLREKQNKICFQLANWFVNVSVWVLWFSRFLQELKYRDDKSAKKQKPLFSYCICSPVTENQTWPDLTLLLIKHQPAACTYICLKQKDLWPGGFLFEQKLHHLVNGSCCECIHYAISDPGRCLTTDWVPSL